MAIEKSFATEPFKSFLNSDDLIVIDLKDAGLAVVFGFKRGIAFFINNDLAGFREIKVTAILTRREKNCRQVPGALFRFRIETTIERIGLLDGMILNVAIVVEHGDADHFNLTPDFKA